MGCNLAFKGLNERRGVQEGIVTVSLNIFVIPISGSSV